MSLAESKNFDVIIVGSGVIGLSIARELRRDGVERVAILEKNPACGTGASFAAAGMLAPQTEADQADDFFQLCQESRNLYPRFAAELFEETGVDIELEQTGTLYLAFHESDFEEIEKRLAWQQAANLPIEELWANEILRLEPNVSADVLGGLRFPCDWQVENRRLIAALNEQQGEICLLNCIVDSMLFESNKVCGVQTKQGKFFASTVVIAAGAWTSLLNFPVKIEIKPIRGQMLNFRTRKTIFRHVIHTPRGYLVPKKNNRILVGATAEDVGFDCRTTSAGMNSLLETIFEISPNYEQRTYVESWSGLRPKSPDGLPLLGEFPEDSGLYFATGHHRNGILLAPLTAELIADKIVYGTDSPFLNIFNPSRFIKKT
ncbi:MAG: glycine oxidase ThiO [Pyrinomonadaceae bacterium]